MFAEVGDGQAHEPVAARFQPHPLEQIAGAPLELRASPSLVLSLAHTQGKPVAQPLELRKREQAGRAGADRGGRRCDVGEAAGDDPRELSLEPGHLRPQRLARRALGGRPIGLRLQVAERFPTIDDGLLGSNHCPPPPRLLRLLDSTSAHHDWGRLAR
jgi:hypothetical protein